MKTHLKFALFWASLALTMLDSCSKEAIKENSIEPFVKVYQSIISIKGEEAKTLAYASLTNLERFDFWKAKFQLAVESNLFTQVQIEQIKEFSNALTPQVFEKTEASQKFKLGFIPAWIEKNKTHFSSIEIYTLLFTKDFDASAQLQGLSIPPKSAKKNITGGATVQVEASAPNCKCATGSSYTCPYITAIPLMVRFGDCYRVKNCNTNVRDCGALLDDACDGDVCSPVMYD